MSDDSNDGQPLRSRLVVISRPAGPLTALPAVQQVLHLADYQKQLHIIYLANDILFKGLSTRAAGAGPDQGALGRRLQWTPPASALCPSVRSPAAQQEECSACLDHPWFPALPAPCPVLQTASRPPSSRAWAPCCAGRT